MLTGHRRQYRHFHDGYRTNPAGDGLELRKLMRRQKKPEGEECCRSRRSTKQGKERFRRP